MKTSTKIILIITDLITIVFGTILFVATVLSSHDDELAATGAGLIVFGLLIHYWRKIYFTSKSDQSDKK